MHQLVTVQLVVSAIPFSIALLYGVIALNGYGKSVTLPFALASLFEGGDRGRRIPLALSIYRGALIILYIVVPAGLFYRFGLGRIPLPWGRNGSGIGWKSSYFANLRVCSWSFVYRLFALDLYSVMEARRTPASDFFRFGTGALFRRLS